MLLLLSEQNQDGEHTSCPRIFTALSLVSLVYGTTYELKNKTTSVDVATGEFVFGSEFQALPFI